MVAPDRQPFGDDALVGRCRRLDLQQHVGRRADDRIIEIDGDIALRTEQAEDEEEHVDEVEVQRQRRHDHGLADHVRTGDLEVQALRTLRVVGGEASEDQHADRADDQAHDARLQEQVDQAGDDQADEADDQERAERRQVALRGIAVEAEAGEARRGREERTGDRGATVDEEDRRERHAHQHRKRPEQQLQRLRLHPALAEAHREHDGERREGDDEAQTVGTAGRADQRVHRAASGEQQGDDAGQQHARSHVVVHRQHVRAQTRVICAAARGIGA
ncbi:hypothetical protein WR25_10296 [Diploscapter pachys]|uniref:Uncharacterized protein n=1 Tax=Diploscapter pachys TaxID=2018661 RepID=A0A2A2K1Q4_9BILA|nr:hypothetical protein WR25_10296 [Diploscapter pachys]